ncbi:MAG: hypothetical protein AAGF28_05610 [Pseudomonadota bacterium]
MAATTRKLRDVALLAGVTLALSGCLTGSPDFVFTTPPPTVTKSDSEEPVWNPSPRPEQALLTPLPKAPTPLPPAPIRKATGQPIGAPQNTGQLSPLAFQRQREAEQISKAEAVAVKNELRNAAARGNAQAAQNNESTYRNEVKRLQNLARSQTRRREAAIAASGKTSE